jgi:hypothetical protein
VAFSLRTAHVEKMRRWKWIVGGSVLALLLVYVLAFLADEPLRRMVEREINGRLQGYTMRLGHLDLHPIPLSLGLRDIVIVQHPDLERPIIRLPRLSASLQFTEGTATARLTGRFMSSGAITISAAFRPETKGADFDLDARIEGTDLTTLNDLLRAHAKADLVSGAFSVFAEARVMNGRVEGYVKPLFRELRLYGAKQDEEKSFGQKFKERAADVMAKVLRNQPRQEVATVVPIGGPLDNPRANTWEALIGLIRNAFDKAILPGFERARLGLTR